MIRKSDKDIGDGVNRVDGGSAAVSLERRIRGLLVFSAISDGTQS